MKKDLHLKKHIWCTVMMILIVAFDQITKYFATLYLSDGKTVTLIKNVVQFKFALNKGIAFSMFSNSRWFFVALTAIVCIAFLVYLYTNKCPSLWAYWSIGVITAGGIGNLIDRALYGYVVDFIEPTFVDFAIFNISDCAVTLGAISLMICIIADFFKKDNKPNIKESTVE